jgi:hypothetical protein
MNLAGVRIQQRLIIVAGFRPPSSKSGQPRFRRLEWLMDSSHLAEILPERPDFGLYSGIWQQ